MLGPSLRMKKKIEYLPPPSWLSLFGFAFNKLKWDRVSTLGRPALLFS